MSINLAVGSRLPAYCTSLGRVLLAYMSERELAAYFKRVTLRPVTHKTKTDRAQIEEALADVRKKGYAIVDEELELGLRSMSIPILIAGAPPSSRSMSAPRSPAFRPPRWSRRRCRICAPLKKA